MSLKNMSMWTLIGQAGVGYVVINYMRGRTVTNKIIDARDMHTDTSASVVEDSGDMQLYGIEKPPNWY